MRHNKFIGWDRFLEVVDKVHNLSPWLSRQIVKQASEWPFLYSGLQVREWDETHIWVHLPRTARSTVEGEVSVGHLLLAAEWALRLSLLRRRQEFPFQVRIEAVQFETHHVVDQSVDIKFHLSVDDWEGLRLAMLKERQHHETFALSAHLADGRLCASFQLRVGFQLEKFLPA